MVEPVSRKWGLFTNHALVMAYVCERSASTVREISDAIGITERATLVMLHDLQHEGIIIRHRVGRSNTYSMDFERLAMFRRGNAGPPTPASFADGLIRTLLELSGHVGTGDVTPRPADEQAFSAEHAPRWGFFTSQLRTLLAVTSTAEPTAHAIARSVGITERAAVVILRQLEEEGMLVRSREGRRNSYRIDFTALDRFARWSSGPWPLQQAIIDVAVDGLRKLEATSGSSVAGAVPNSTAAADE